MHGRLLSVAAGIIAVAVALYQVATAAPLHDTPSRRIVRTFDLGWRNHRNVQCNVLAAPVTSSASDYSLEFVCRSRDGKVRRLRVEVGESARDSVSIVAGDFERSGHPEVFMGISFQAASGAIWDCDGTHVDKRYASRGGRVFTSIFRGQHGRWLIEEHWPVRQWDDEDGLGVGHQYGVNMVERTLRWNGRSWDNVQPGTTRIVGRVRGT